jgi:hypothetical protein
MAKWIGEARAAELEEADESDDEIVPERLSASNPHSTMGTDEPVTTFWRGGETPEEANASSD